MAAGLAVIFAGGLAWLAYGPTALGVCGAVRTALTPFLAADLVKLCLAAGVLPAVWRFVGRRLAGSAGLPHRRDRCAPTIPKTSRYWNGSGVSLLEQPQAGGLRVLDHDRLVDRSSSGGPGPQPSLRKSTMPSRPDGLQRLAHVVRSSTGLLELAVAADDQHGVDRPLGEPGLSCVPSTIVTLRSPSRWMRRIIDSIIGFWTSSA